MVGRWGGEVCGEVDDKFAVDDEIVRRLFQISRQHLYAGVQSVYMCHDGSVKETTIATDF